MSACKRHIFIILESYSAGIWTLAPRTCRFEYFEYFKLFGLWDLNIESKVPRQRTTPVYSLHTSVAKYRNKILKQTIFCFFLFSPGGVSRLNVKSESCQGFILPACNQFTTSGKNWWWYRRGKACLVRKVARMLWRTICEEKFTTERPPSYFKMGLSRPI